VQSNKHFQAVYSHEKKVEGDGNSSFDHEASIKETAIFSFTGYLESAV